MAGKKRTPILKKPGVQTLLASLVCILLGLLVGYVVLLVINPAGAKEAISDIVRNFWNYPNQRVQLKYLGNTLVKTAPLLMCSLSVLFAYKVGLFNIGAAGQYVAGAGAALYCALALKMPWWVCLIAALVSGALLGVISGALKAYFNVNEVISCIMLNWIMLYCVNMLLTPLAPAGMPDTETVTKVNPAALLPSLGLGQYFTNNRYVTIAIPIAIVAAVLIWILLNKTKLGYELRATGANKHAAKYAGMRERFNLILTMAIAGGLAGMGAAMYFLTDYQQWAVTQSAVPAMGFNGIAAAFLGGLNPIGVIFSSYFIEHITSGGTYVNMSMYSAEISELISAVIIYLCGFVMFFRSSMTKLVDNLKLKATRRGVCIALAIIALVLVVLVQMGDIGEQGAQIDSLNAQVTKLTDEKKVAQDKQKTAETDKKAAETSLKEAEASLADAEVRLAELTAQYEAALKQIEEMSVQSDAAAADMSEMEATLLELQQSVQQAMDALKGETPADNNGEEGTEE